jgi:Flp pilus assembly protein TadG
VRHVHRSRGQSLLEFALIVPIFLLFLFGLIDFSRLLFTYISLANGTRELARVAAMPSTTTTNPSAPVSVFNNLTLFGGPVANGATQVTFTNASSQSISCTVGATGCLLSLSTPKGSATTTLTNSLAQSVSYTFTSAPDPAAFRATANGDYVMVTTVNSQINGYDGTVRVCPLPLTSSCVLGAPATASDGFVDVAVVYDFRFNPLFENRLAGIIDASFMRPISTLRTSTRTYVE